MDPFCIIAFGRKIFRTRVIRHSLNPTWDEKLLFHVRKYETNFKVQLTVLDWDKLSSNDHVGDASFSISELVSKAPQKDTVTGLYPEECDGTQDGMQEFRLPLQTAKETPWEGKHNPVSASRAVIYCDSPDPAHCDQSRHTSSLYTSRCSSMIHPRFEGQMVN